MIKELDTIVLSRDIPEYGLSRGDIGAVVHRYKGGSALEIEFVTGEGETIGVVTLDTRDVRPMHANELLHFRKLKAA